MKKHFISAMKSHAEMATPALWFAFSNGNLLVQNDTLALPELTAFTTLGLTVTQQHYLGTLDGQPCFTVELETDVEPPLDMALYELRSLFGQLDEDWIALASRAVQLIAWENQHQFCGRCGTRTEAMQAERARRCPECSLTAYPRISPCIIVRVTRGAEILLARGHRWQPGWFSVLAGFIEPGETLEEAVEREVWEEVGIRVKNIHYFSSQSWPFPNSLMMGFTAEYAGGELHRQEDEIAEAGWFTVETMPNTPSGEVSIAGRLIEAFLAGRK